MKIYLVKDTTSSNEYECFNALSVKGAVEQWAEEEGLDINDLEDLIVDVVEVKTTSKIRYKVTSPNTFTLTPITPASKRKRAAPKKK